MIFLKAMRIVGSLSDAGIRLENINVIGRGQRAENPGRRRVPCQHVLFEQLSRNERKMKIL